jgi:hypothetical protein
MWFKSFLQRTSSKVVSGDTMMNKAWGPVWHTKQKAHGLIPEGLHGVDREAAWGKSQSDGWVHGHGSFRLVPHSPYVLGTFKYMCNSAHEATCLWLETGHLQGVVTTVIMALIERGPKFRPSTTLSATLTICMVVGTQRPQCGGRW